MLVFVLSAAVVVAAGLRLARDGDAIAEGTGLGGMWVGAILVAAATSLPELTTDVSAVLQGHPALAVGDLFGSNMANMLILAITDLAVRDTRVLARVAIDQAFVGVLAIVLTAVAALGVLAPAGATVGVGWPVALIALGYAAGMRLLHQNRSAPPFGPSAAERPPSRGAVRRAAAGFAVAAIAILVAAPFLASSASELAERAGISSGLAGMALLALITSMPELVVAVSAVRRGSYDLAVGNLLGSNCFNMAALLPLDVADGRASLLAGVGPEIAVGAVGAIVLTGLALIDVLDRGDRRRAAIELYPLGMVIAYGVILYLAYAAQGGG